MLAKSFSTYFGLYDPKTKLLLGLDGLHQELWQEAEREFSATFDSDRQHVDGHVELFHEKVHALMSRPLHSVRTLCES